MKGGHLHRGATHEHGLQHRERRGLALAADGDLDGPQPGAALLGGELVCHRPARVVAGDAQLRPEREVVHLDHHAVGLVVVGVPPLLGGLHVVLHGGQILGQQPGVVDRET